VYDAPPFRCPLADGLVFSYVHQPAAPGMGKLASVVQLGPGEGSAAAVHEAAPALREAGNGLALHVAGMSPRFVSRQAVPAAVLDAERRALTAAAAEEPGNAGKPDKVRPLRGWPAALERVGIRMQAQVCVLPC
jgi:translation elongation factor EF-Ts